MGLHAVDTENAVKPRTPRSGAATYREITAAGGLTEALLSAWPVTGN